MDASSLNYSDLLKPFQLLQLIIGGAVFMAVCFVILKGRSENKKDGHIAAPGHDSMPAGAQLVSQQILQFMVMMVENLRGIRDMLHAVHVEQTKTNSRLAELQETHKGEMEQLRDTIAASRHEPSRPRRG